MKKPDLITEYRATKMYLHFRGIEEQEDEVIRLRMDQKPREGQRRDGFG